VATVMLDSVASFRAVHGDLLNLLEWIFTILFTLEYGLRIYSVGRPRKYIFSFYGLVDLLSILPTYLGLIFVGTHYLAAIRILRVCRVFRVLKFSLYLGEANLLVQSLAASRRRITVFLSAVLSLVVIFGSLMYVVEGSQPGTGFTSIPRGVYWAVVTMTTVGYGDISPMTPLGQAIASVIMILGYSIIAIPTGIVTAEMVGLGRSQSAPVSTQACPECSQDGHDMDAQFCKYCGANLHIR
jgi:voltage-gated potassium channel